MTQTTKIAGLSISKINGSASPELRRAFARIGCSDYELTSFRNGQIEVYAIHDGMAEFEGHLSEWRLSSSFRRAAEAVWTIRWPSRVARRALELTRDETRQTLCC